MVGAWFTMPLTFTIPHRAANCKAAKCGYTPVRSKGGVYVSCAEVTSCKKPLVMPQFSRYAAAARYSLRRTWRANTPCAPGRGVYWLISENSTSPSRKREATQSIQRFVFSNCPGSTRWRMITPRVKRPSSTRQGPV